MPKVAVASFNLHWGLDRRGAAFDQVAACRRLDADVLVLQEAWRQEGERGAAATIADELGYQVHLVELAQARWGKTPRIVQQLGRAHGRWGFAVLTRQPVRRVWEIDMGRMWLDVTRRAALAVEVALGASTLTVIATHLSHLSHGSPIQVRRLRQDLPDPSQPAVLLGDLNMWGPWASALLPGWKRAVKGRTWPAHRPHSQIDHILVSGPVKVLDSGVGVFSGSDHRPVRAVLSIP